MLAGRQQARVLAHEQERVVPAGSGCVLVDARCHVARAPAAPGEISRAVTATRVIAARARVPAQSACPAK